MYSLLIPILCLFGQALTQKVEDEFVFTETVTESKDFATSTATTIAATKTVYLVPTKRRPWWQPWSQTRQPFPASATQEAITETETEYVYITITEQRQYPQGAPQTIAPLTVTRPITKTITTTKVELHWKSVPVEVMYYTTITQTTTARPLIADLLPKIEITPPTKTVYTREREYETTYSSPPLAAPQQPGVAFPNRQPGVAFPNRQPEAAFPNRQPIQIPQGRIPLAGELAKNLEYQMASQTLTPSTSTVITTVLSTVTPPGDWKEYKTATLNACDVCRQNCTNLNSNCCVMECAGQPMAVPVPVAVPPPVPPINPDAIPCDDPLMT